ncbi:MAG: serine/threonine-protein kinase, partial [Gemmatimonadales bacterium]
MSVCPSCNAPFPDGFSFCPKCGAATPSSVAVSEADTVVAPTGGSAKSIGRVQRAVGDEYRVERLVGQGGFAEVFAAHDPRLKRTVAIKVLRPDLIVNQELVDRFQREAEAIAGLRHPNIMQIYTVGERDGVAYFVMPFVEGQSLREVIDAEGRLSLFEAKRIAIDAAKALAAAHAKGLVHRDVKPDNIMLEGEERHVLLTDFGIARAVASGETRITGTGMIIGTPQYMSPEQAAGDEDIDHRTDIYSLGVVIYQMITGALPFKGTSIQ